MSTPELLVSVADVDVWHGDCRDILPIIERADHLISDPPYSKHTHSNARGNRGEAGIVERDFGFEHLKPSLRRFVAQWACERAIGWIAVFTDRESSWLWRLSIEAAGGSYRRTIPWVRWSAPQFNGQAPPSSAEDIVFSKPRRRERKWINGARQLYDTPCLRRHNKEGHTTEKPVSLMMEILGDCTLPGDLIVDPFCGSGTTLISAMRMGRRAIGIEADRENAKLCAERVAAEASGSTRKAMLSGQRALFERIGT